MYNATSSPRPTSLRFPPLLLPLWCCLFASLCCGLPFGICSLNLSPGHWSPISKGQSNNSPRWVATLTPWFSTEGLLNSKDNLTTRGDFGLSHLVGGYYWPVGQRPEMMPYTLKCMAKVPTQRQQCLDWETCLYLWSMYSFPPKFHFFHETLSERLSFLLALNFPIDVWH